jgi:hypothetical protein
MNGTDCERNLPNAMRSAGYRTRLNGKWYLSPLERPGPETRPEYGPLQEIVLGSGFDWADGLYSHVMPVIAEDLTFSHNMEWVTAMAKVLARCFMPPDAVVFIHRDFGYPESVDSPRLCHGRQRSLKTSARRDVM